MRSLNASELERMCTYHAGKAVSSRSTAFYLHAWGECFRCPEESSRVFHARLSASFRDFLELHRIYASGGGYSGVVYLAVYDSMARILLFR